MSSLRAKILVRIQAAVPKYNDICLGESDRDFAEGLGPKCITVSGAQASRPRSLPRGVSVL